MITGVGVRRRWSADAKAEVMLDRWCPVRPCGRWRAVTICSRLCGARRAAEPTPGFVPVVVEPEALAAPAPKKQRKPRAGGDIEIEIYGVVVRIGSGAEAKGVAAVIQALKAVR